MVSPKAERLNSPVQSSSFVLFCSSMDCGPVAMRRPNGPCWQAQATPTLIRSVRRRETLAEITLVSSPVRSSSGPVTAEGL